MLNSTFEYKITADDYLTHQLFGASMNKVVKLQRKRGLILWSLAFFILAIIFLFQENNIIAAYFGLFGIVFIFIYPFYSGWIYKRYYKRFVYENFYKTKLENVELRFINDEIVISNGENEGRIPIYTIEIIYEISSHYFIKLDKGKNIIIPKLEIKNVENLTHTINSIIQENSIQYCRILDWKWK